MDRIGSIVSMCIRDLLSRKADLERAFDLKRRKDPLRINPHDYYAYTNVIRAIVDIARSAPPGKTDPDEMRRKASEILEREYGIRRG